MGNMFGNVSRGHRLGCSDEDKMRPRTRVFPYRRWLSGNSKGINTKLSINQTVWCIAYCWFWDHNLTLLMFNFVSVTVSQDITKLTPLSPEVISRQATINIGTIGHVAHGKSTVVKAISGVHTVRFKNELERNITIKLGESRSILCKKRRMICFPFGTGCHPEMTTVINTVSLKFLAIKCYFRVSCETAISNGSWG